MFSNTNVCNKTARVLPHVMRFVTSVVNADWVGEFITDAHFNDVVLSPSESARRDTIRKLTDEIEDPVERARMELAHPNIDTKYTTDGHKTTTIYDIESLWDNYELCNSKAVSGLIESKRELKLVLEFAIRLLEINGQIHIDWGYEGIEGVGPLSDLDNVLN